MRAIVPGQANLFIDDRWIAYHTRATRTPHQARPHAEPLLRAEHPWEGRVPVMFGTVLRHYGVLKCWYTIHHGVSPTNICYAESTDGVAWHKPALGLHEYAGSTANNICLRPFTTDFIDCISVIADPQDERWPLKALFWEGPARDARGWGIKAARSADGRRWEPYQGFALPGWGDRFNAVGERLDGKFVVYGRANEGGYYRDQNRCVWRTESDDLVQWSPPVLVMRPSLDDEPQFRIYSLQAFPYEGQLLALEERMHCSPDLVDTELVHSADGLEWRHLARRQAFIPLGQRGQWNGNWLMHQSGPPLLVDGRLYFFTSGRSGCHATPYPTIGALGLATLRRDGFVSLGNRGEAGYLETPPCVWQGADLAVNVDNRDTPDDHPRLPHGWCGVEVLDAQGEVVPGYGLDDCTRLVRNSERESADCYLPVRWTGDRRLGALAGQPIRLRIWLQDARVFGFRGLDDL